MKASEAVSERRTGVLQGEHLLLGASFQPSEGTGLLGVSSYAAEGALDTSEALLADLTGCAYLLVSGADAEAFSALALCGRRLEVGECGFEATLTGDGALLGAPLALRTGDHETVVVDATRAREAVAAWLAFLSHARSAEGGEAFPQVEVEDASEMLVPLLLGGNLAPEVLRDYLHDGEDLPDPGTVKQLRLDAIPCVVAAIEGRGAAPAYLLLVPPASARVLWRSLLSFSEVSPIGHRALESLLAKALPWAARLDGTGPVKLSREELEGWGILREEADFVGGRALA